jgi:hypothetical protein
MIKIVCIIEVNKFKTRVVEIIYGIERFVGITPNTSNGHTTCLIPSSENLII